MQQGHNIWWKGMRNWFKKAIVFITPSNRTLKACGIGIFLLSFLFFSFNTADGFLTAVGFGYYLFTLLCYTIVAYLVAAVISFIISLAGKTPRYFRQSIAFVIFFILFFDRLSWPYNWIVIGSIVIFSSLIFGALSYWRQANESQYPKKRLLPIIAFCLGFIGLASGLFLFLYAGIPVKPTKNYKILAKLPPPLEAPNPAQKGKWKVSVLSYGSGKDKHRAIYGSDVTLKTPAVDASFLLKSWTGVSGKLRTWYFGFNETALPLNAMVWYPNNLQAPAPLVLIVHGNHLAQDWSEGGYDYLGELLASRGYIVASVDENFLNGSFTDMPRGGLEGENGTRGWLMLKHLELWKKWSEDPSNPFYQRVDMNNIALIGHSRGGEAMSHAALFNTLPSFPDNANEKFDFNFPIKAYIAIAPVDGQYKPASILATLHDVNYFVIQGTHDMDMQSYGGLSTYKRIQYSPSYQGFKAGLYVHHANHGQFNTSWGKYDASSPFINQFNMTNLMSAKDQEQIAKVYISAFLDIHLKNITDYKPLFVDYRYGRNWLPDQIYFNQYESSESTFIARYEEDLNLETATAPGVRIHSNNLSVWKEAQNNLMWRDHLSRAVYIGWNWEKDKALIGKYTFDFADSARFLLQGKALVFNLATSNESSLHIEKGKKSNQEKKKEKKASANDKKRKQIDEETNPIDFTIELIDKKGNKVHFLLSSCTPLQAQIQKKLTKFAFLNANEDSEAIPDFFYFDLDKLQKDHPTFDLNNLRSLSFVFDQSPSGVVILDDVSFMKL